MSLLFKTIIEKEISVKIAYLNCIMKKHDILNEWKILQNSVTIYEAIQDLLVIVPMNKSTYDDFYNEYKSSPHIVATLIWTYNKI